MNLPTTGASAHSAGAPPGYPQPPGYFPYPPRPPLPVPVAPDGRPLADFGLRLLAVMIDSALLYAVGALFYLPLIAVLVYDSARFDATTGAAYEPGGLVVTALIIELVVGAVLLVGYFVYYVEMLHRHGQTLGKRAMRIRVIPLEPGAPLTRSMAAKRFLADDVAGILVPFYALLDGLWQLRDKPYQQTLHDKFARTVVVKVSP